MNKFQSLADLICDSPGHLHTEGLVVLLHEILLEITAGHVLHYDAVVAFADELFFKTNNVRTVPALRLYCYLTFYAFLRHCVLFSTGRNQF